MDALSATFSPAFAQRALLEIVLVGILCGVVGVHVVLRRLSFFAMTMGHATFPGVALAALLGVNLLLGAGAFGVVLVLLVVAVGAQRRIDDTSAIGVVLAGGFALGVLLVSFGPDQNRDLAAFLVGSLVTVQRADLIITAGATVAVLAVLAALHKELVLGAFDRAGLVAQGYPALRLDLVLLLCLQTTLVACVPAVGTFLSVALLAAPAAAARLWTDRVGSTMALAVAFAVGSGVLGLAISQNVRVAAGGAIVLVATAVFVVSLLIAPRHGLLARLRARRVELDAEPALG
jgi:ABC-type Mn2+/Zn2+ transport system permease subunit